ncbi:glycerol-3-phosphate dehydrogenase [Marinobacterium sedimentorum]|uniref:glycerol-3-phosphate dehydrogenase n=1 Tax=Marinobacterium sedimentorum TaxID=2927804 RepID=UPI0020C6B2DF|nr:glycerol-3-phosphate dehydrogenase [Marinobacterium sedimentorum]MCP8687794.1 glycerol-3-phosphate dehydrogenase [Marinobacterium sedimentorum]
MTSEQTVQDLIVIGGGVNGAGIAMDAAGRGLQVLLCEMDDLASATSSSSSKLIHGGLRYLEHYEFRLVREALAERECLLRNSPHIMWPLRFRLPHRPHLRPAWMIRAGLFLYDNLAKRELLPASNGIKFAPQGPLINEITRGFEYSDGWVDDARLVVLVAMAAREKGADIRTRSRAIKAEREGELWAVTLKCQRSGNEEVHYCRALVNAAGPWVSRLFNETMTIPAPKQIRMVKGSHIVVPRIHDEHQAYILQNEDNRIVFVIPYEDNFSLVGTTDVDYQGNPRDVAISAEETDYLISVVNSHFKHKIAVSDVVWSYSGVRPLMDDEAGSAQKASRDYAFETDVAPGKAPLLSVFGGKITTYRKLAEAATNSICEHFPKARGAWTRNAALPGGDFENQHKLLSQLARQYPWLPVALARRFVRTYGTLSHSILKGCTSIEDLGTHFGATLYAREVRYLVEQEWALELEDVLWRRTKQGLYLQETECAAVATYLEGLLGEAPLTLISNRG